MKPTQAEPIQKLVVGNLKMNILSIAERTRYSEGFRKHLKGKSFRRVGIVLCPPFIHLEHFTKNLKRKGLAVGAQNMFSEEKGAFTGEISPMMLKNLGVTHVILGHSERRRYFAEDEPLINAKITKALKLGLTPVCCIGETRAERDNGTTKDRLAAQLFGALAGISGPRLDQILIAYEPVWAVGTDVFPSSNEIMEVKILIRKLIAERYGMRYAEKLRILYGGSVNARVAGQVCVDPGMDGVLVGRESLTPADFLAIAQVIEKW